MEDTALAKPEELALLFEPTQIIKISVGELSAPVETAIELQKLAILEKTLLMDILQHSDRDEESGKLFIHPEALGWARELRMILKDIHDLTKGVQEKVMLKKMDVMGNLYKQVLKDKKPEDIIRTIRELQNVEPAK